MSPIESITDTTIKKLRTHSGWWEGDARARTVLAEFLAAARKLDAEDADVAWHREQMAAKGVHPLLALGAGLARQEDRS